MSSSGGVSGASAEVSALLSALSSVHSESSTAAQRFHGQQVVEDFKAHSPPSLLLSTSTSLFTSTPSTSLPTPLTPSLLQHFSLHLLESLISTHWTSLSPSDQSSLQSYALHLLLTLSSPSPSPPPHLLVQKVVSLTCDLIMRTWPQHWPSLLPSLTSLPPQSPLWGSLFLCLIYRELAEEVTRVGAVAEQRRQDVHGALLLSLDTIVPFLLSSLESTEGRVVEAAMDAMGTLVEWIPIQWLFETNLIPRVLSLMGGGGAGGGRVGFPQVMDFLAVVTGRRSGELDVHTHLLSVWNAVLLALNGLLASPTFPHQYSYLMKTIAVLSHLIRIHPSLLTSESSSGPIPPPSPSLPQRFLTTLGMLLSHPHPSISLEALELWVFVFRQHSSTLLPPSYRPALVSELFRVCLVKVIKPSMDSIPHTDDELEESEYIRIFSHFRGTLTSLIHHMVEAEAEVCFQLSWRRYTEMLGESAGLDHLNAWGYVTTSSQKFKEMESLSSVLDSMFRALPPSVFAGSKLGETATALLALLLGFQTSDPLLQTRRLQALSLFTPIYLCNPPTLTPTISTLLSSVTFRSDREQSMALSDLSEDTKACRRRAVHSLTHIARKCGIQLLSSLDLSLRTVLDLVERQQVGEEERTLLMEFLVTVSAASPQREVQGEFVRKIIGPQAERWGKEGMQETIRGGRGWLQLVGGGVDEVEAVRSVDPNGDEETLRRRVKSAIAPTQGKLMRNEVLGSINAFASVFKGVLRGTEEAAVRPTPAMSAPHGEGDIPHPSVPLLFALLPSLCQLLSSIYGLRAPSSEALLPPSMRGVVASSVEHLRLLRASSPLSSHPDHLHSVLLHLFLEQSTDALLLLLSIATKAGSTLYSHFDLPLFQSTLLVHIPYLHPHQLRFLLERFVINAQLECEPRFYSTGLMAFLSSLWGVVVSRLSTAWREVKGQQERRGDGRGNEAVEIWEENELRECTRTFADSFGRILNTFDLRSSTAEAAGGGAQKVTKDQSNHLSLSECPFFAFIFSQPSLSSSLLSTLRFLLLAPDSQSQSKAARLGLRIVPLACAHTELNPNLAALLSICLTYLSSIYYSPTALTTVDSDMVALATAIYQQAGKRSEEVRTVVRGWTPQGGDSGALLSEMEGRMWGQTMSEKKYRALFKGWLSRCVLGKEGGKKDVKVNQLADRWERDEGKKQREYEERGAHIEGGELSTLFDSSTQR